jgi:hypothetical protein
MVATHQQKTGFQPLLSQNPAKLCLTSLPSYAFSRIANNISLMG